MQYFWVKLYKDFFSRPKIKFILKQRNGATAAVVYLRLLLLALNSEGRLQPEGFSSSLEKELAIILDMNASTLSLAIGTLKNAGLVVPSDSDEDGLYLPDLAEMVGEAPSTARSRKCRDKKKAEKAKAEKEADESGRPQEGSATAHQEADATATKGGDATALGEAESYDLQELDTIILPASSAQTEPSFSLPHKADLLVRTWNAMGVKEINKVLRVEPGSEREKKLLSLCERYSENDIMAALENIPKSDYLCGRNKQSLPISFDWFILPENFLKVLENKYMAVAPVRLDNNIDLGYDNISIMKDW